MMRERDANERVRTFRRQTSDTAERGTRKRREICLKLQILFFNPLVLCKHIDLRWLLMSPKMHTSDSVERSLGSCKMVALKKDKKAVEGML